MEGKVSAFLDNGFASTTILNYLDVFGAPKIIKFGQVDWIFFDEEIDYTKIKLHCQKIYLQNLFRLFKHNFQFSFSLSLNSLCKTNNLCFQYSYFISCSWVEDKNILFAHVSIMRLDGMQNTGTSSQLPTAHSKKLSTRILASKASN